MKTKKKQFAWYPIKTTEGWVWLKFVWKETTRELQPILKFIADKKYQKEIMNGLQK